MYAQVGLLPLVVTCHLVLTTTTDTFCPPLQPPLSEQPPTNEGKGPPRAPSRSYIEMLYPFSSNPTLREQYRRFETNELRYGLILEDIDTFAGDVAKRHAGPSVNVVVTGFVDKISWLQHGALGALAVDRDLRMAGQVLGVGSPLAKKLHSCATAIAACMDCCVPWYCRLAAVDTCLTITCCNVRVQRRSAGWGAAAWRFCCSCPAASQVPRLPGKFLALLVLLWSQGMTS